MPATADGEGGGGPALHLTATVYGLCERGELAYVRISTHAIRIAEPSRTWPDSSAVAPFGEHEPPGQVAEPPAGCCVAWDGRLRPRLTYNYNIAMF